MLRKWHGVRPISPHAPVGISEAASGTHSSEGGEGGVHMARYVSEGGGLYHVL